MITPSFVSSKKFAAVLSCALAATLASCGNSSPNGAAQNGSAPAPAQTPAPASAQNPPPPPAQQPPAGQQSSMSVAELTGQSNAPAPNGQPPADNAGMNPPPATPPAQQGALASASYAPRPGNAVPPPPPPQDSGEYAQVISVTPLSGPQRVCTDQTVTERRPQSDDHQVAGTVIGAIAGGVIGNQFGHGKGRALTTAAGAVGGGIAGKKIQEAHQEGDTVTRVVKRCRNVVPGKDSPQLYDVVYAYQGQNLHARLDYDPGNRVALPVRGVQSQ